MAPPPKPDGAASPAKLAIGVVGIFGAFLYYGQLMGDIVKYQAEDGSKLEREWFLQVLDAAANVLVGLAGLILTQGGPSPSIPYKSFLLTGSTQVLAKAMTQKAQIYGVPFFLATLVKNAKMVPVMVGAIVLSGTRYPARKWAQVALIIGGVVLVTVGKARKPGASDGHADVIGMACLGLSLVCDGTTRCANQISRLTRRWRMKGTLMAYEGDKTHRSTCAQASRAASRRPSRRSTRRRRARASRRTT